MKIVLFILSILFAFIATATPTVTEPASVTTTLTEAATETESETIIPNELEKAVDPFSSVEHIKYPNGLQVFLAQSPQAANTEVRLEVKVGWDAEDSSSWGLSHLLEHVLFRDKQLKDEMTYLQLIDEAGGSANGSTGQRVTSYFGTIPAKKGLWLLESFGKMLLKPTISEEYVDLERGTVELEIGKPSPISVFLGFNPMDHLYPRYLKAPDFWESEFNVSHRQDYTKTDEQLSNRRLTTAQVKQHYQDFYYPANMALFVVGNFDREAVLKRIEKDWASQPERKGKVLAALPKPTPRKAPFKGITLTTETPYFYIGTKAWDITVKDHEVMSSYLNYLSHRLMKEIRNLKGQTYTAAPYYDDSEGYGYLTVGFQSPTDHMKNNLKLVNSKLQTEAYKGGLTEEQVKEAIDLHLADYFRRGKESNDMMALAQWYQGIYDLYGKFESPFATLRDVSSAEYNEILQKHFKPEHKYEYFYEPYYFFHYDIFLFYFVVAIGTFFVLRGQLTKPFQHDQLKWIRKIQFPPLKMLELVVLCLGAYAFTHFHHALNLVFSHSYMQSHILIAEYLRSIVWAVALLVTAVGVFSLLPRKLMVMGSNLVIKTVTYYSRHIPLSQIEKVEELRFLSRDFAKLVIRTNYKFKFYYFSPLFWKPGLALHFKSGEVIFISVRHASQAKSEVEGFLNKPQSKKASEAA